VILLGRRRHLAAIRQNGLLITGIWGDYRIKALELYDDPRDIEARSIPFDLIFLTVKSYDTENAVNELLPLMNANTTLVSFQNGLGNIETILKKVDANRFLVGRVIFGVETEPGIAKVTVSADAVALGALPGASPLMSAERLAHLFSLCKIEAKAVPNILTILWSKVVYNCALNGICTIHEIPYGKVLENQETKELMREVVRECYAIAERKGILMQPVTVESYWELLTGTLIPRTASHFPSMLQDLKKEKPIDIDALNGAIVVYGREFAIPTPANARIVAEVKQKFVNRDIITPL
jgi:2-dehydropantoate 2-reductase